MIHWRRYFSELIGTAALLCAVIGSGIMAEQLAGGQYGDCAFGQYSCHGLCTLCID